MAIKDNENWIISSIKLFSKTLYNENLKQIFKPLITMIKKLKQQGCEKEYGN